MDKTNSAYNDLCSIGFNDKWVLRVGLPLIAMTIPVLFFDISPLYDLILYLKLSVLSLLNTAVFWRVQKWFLVGIRKQIPQHKDYFKRLLIQVMVFSITTYLLSDISCMASSFIPQYMLEAPSVTPRRIILASFTVSALLLAMYEAKYFFDLWKIELVENEQLKTENTKAQLSILKNQVNPHFLFNSLNTLTAIIPDHPEIAVRFVEKLSAVYRHVIEIKNKETISLSEELKHIDSYEFLLKIRFEDKLIIKKDIDNRALSMYVVPMALQMVIENAVKHNVVSASDPLIIHIHSDSDQLIISNEIRLKNQVVDSTQTGLENIRQRYYHLTNQKMKWTGDDNVFKVYLPLLEISNP